MADLIKRLLKSNKDVIEIASEFSIEELEKVITYSADKYYNTSKDIISD